jgi:hypothetical protein
VFDGTLSGYRVKAGPTNIARAAAFTDANALVLQLSITRAPVTAAFAILILFLQALLAVAAASLAIVVRKRNLHVEGVMLTWLAALLFAIVPLRNAMPGAPPIGALVDVLIFFWAVTVITLSLVVVLITMYRQRLGQQ